MPPRHRLPDYVTVQAPRQSDLVAPDLSIVIPAYNEAYRIPQYLDAIHDYFSLRGEAHEVLVVDDGSGDRTADTVRALMRARPRLGLLRYEENRGKGHAVRMGMLAARGRLRLMADADGSTPIGEIERLRAHLPADGPAVVVGSRWLRAPDVHRSVKLLRRVTGRTFGVFRHALLNLSMMDTQCGFKLFDSIAAEALFRLARIDGFAFDVEILHLADKARIPVTEAAITWRDSGTSRVSLLTEPAKMVRDVWRIRRMHRGTVVSVDRTTPSAACAEP